MAGLLLSVAVNGVIGLVAFFSRKTLADIEKANAATYDELKKAIGEIRGLVTAQAKFESQIGFLDQRQKKTEDEIDSLRERIHALSSREQTRENQLLAALQTANNPPTRRRG